MFYMNIVVVEENIITVIKLSHYETVSESLNPWSHIAGNASKPFLHTGTLLSSAVKTTRT